MKINKDKLKKLPFLTKRLCEQGALLTGGVVTYLLDEADKYKDIDIVVPVEHWRSLDLPRSIQVSLNYYNGLHFVHDGTSYDVWPVDTYNYLYIAEKDKKPLRVLDIDNGRIFVKTRLDTKEERSLDEIPF